MPFIPKALVAAIGGSQERSPFSELLTGNEAFAVDLSYTLEPVVDQGSGYAYARDDSDATVRDCYGTVVEVKADEPRFEKARRVWNMCRGVGYLSSPGTNGLVNKIQDPFGGWDAWRVTALAATNVSTDMPFDIGASLLLSDPAINSYWIRYPSTNDSGTGLNVRTGTLAGAYLNVLALGIPRDEWVLVQADPIGTGIIDGYRYLGFQLLSPEVGDYVDIAIPSVELVPFYATSQAVAQGTVYGAACQSLMQDHANNSNFENGTIGDWYDGVGGAVSYVSTAYGPALRITNTGAASGLAVLGPFEVTIGKKYEITYHSSGGGGGYLGISNNADGSSPYNEGFLSAAPYGLSTIVEPTATTIYLTFRPSSTSAAAWVEGRLFDIGPVDQGAIVDGVKYFNTGNGNTVSGNIITLGEGNLLQDPPGVLIESARTNSKGFSSDLSSTAASGWTQNLVAVAAATGKIGPWYGWKPWEIKDGTSAGSHNLQRRPIPGIAIGDYALSSYVKLGAGVATFHYHSCYNGTDGSGAVYFDLETGNMAASGARTSVEYGMSPVGDGWWRCWSKWTCTALDNGYFGMAEASGVASYTPSGAGNNIQYWAIFEEEWGVDYATSYIDYPAAAGAVTRDADFLSYGVENYSDEMEIDLEFEIDNVADAGSTPSRYLYRFADAGGTAYAEAFITTTGYLNVRRQYSGAGDRTVLISSAPITPGRHRVQVRHSLAWATCSATIDGVAVPLVTWNNCSAFPALTYFCIGNWDMLDNQIDCRINWMRITHVSS